MVARNLSVPRDHVNWKKSVMYISVMKCVGGGSTPQYFILLHIFQPPKNIWTVFRNPRKLCTFNWHDPLDKRQNDSDENYCLMSNIDSFPPSANYSDIQGYKPITFLPRTPSEINHVLSPEVTQFSRLVAPEVRQFNHVDKLLTHQNSDQPYSGKN